MEVFNIFVFGFNFMLGVFAAWFTFSIIILLLVLLTGAVRAWRNW